MIGQLHIGGLILVDRRVFGLYFAYSWGFDWRWLLIALVGGFLLFRCLVLVTPIFDFLGGFF
jgi:hypothetical protein